ncbi:MAG: molybdenum cofactor guanylyltransferase [Trueperaceae bacterium]|nr:MAG: molybdenum cofactor guanylyltransferase [Trueperaceae bacterium]
MAVTPGRESLSFSGAVLAGGRSRRFGRDKAVTPFRGKPLLEWVLISLRDAEETFIVANRPYPLFELDTYRDLIVTGSSLSGVHTALVKAQNDWVAVAACDLPNLTPAFWQLLASRAGPQQAVMLEHPDGKLEPLAALYHKRALQTVEAKLETGRYSLHELAHSLDTHFVPAEQASMLLGPLGLVNVNRPEDLDETE